MARKIIDSTPTLVEVYTTAPVAYDYPYVTQINATAGVDSSGKVWRRVSMPANRLEAQSARYQSGWHPSMPAREFLRAMRQGFVSSVVPS